MPIPYLNSEGEIIFPDDQIKKMEKQSGTHHTDSPEYNRYDDNHSPEPVNHIIEILFKNFLGWDKLGNIEQIERLTAVLKTVYTLATEREVDLDQETDLTALQETMLAGFYSISIDAEHAFKRAESWLEKARQEYQIDERDYQKIGD
tara:strand:- start:531 stop:971 length:441 start_codon:yes stop_codon:yes gene_type:complete